MTPERMSLKDAVAHFGVSYDVLYRAVRADELPAVQVGTRWNVRSVDVREWIVAHGSPNGAEQERAS